MNVRNLIGIPDISNSPNALVLLSGGQDSATALLWALEHFERVETISFDYGQRHSTELDMAERLAAHAQVGGLRVWDHHVLDLGGILGASALLDPDLDLNDEHMLDEDLPASFVPGRNILFFTVAAQLAVRRRIGNLVGGMCQTDFSGYPDCRRAFIDSMEGALSQGLGKDLRIHTPLMYLTKAETWKLAAEYNAVQIIREGTLTDYNGDTETLNAWGYGKEDNPASKLRAEGYREAVEKGWIEDATQAEPF